MRKRANFARSGGLYPLILLPRPNMGGDRVTELPVQRDRRTLSPRYRIRFMLVLTVFVFEIFQPFCQHFTVVSASPTRIPTRETVPQQVRAGHNMASQYSETERLRKPQTEQGGSERIAVLPSRRIESMIRYRSIMQHRPRSIQLYGSKQHPAFSPGRWRC